MKSTVTLRTLSFALLVTVCVAFIGVTASAQRRRRPPAKPAKHLTICGNPNVSCVTSLTFEPYALPFQMPQSSVIYDTEFFYAVVLKSVSTANNNCDNYIPEPERLAAQILFPDKKVFASRCAEPGEVSYTNTSPRANFMAVYAGPTLADANRMLATVQATRKFSGANIRRMRAVINGT